MTPTAYNTKMSKAKASLIIGQPFFANLLMHLREEKLEDDLMKMLYPTMATDGERLLVNPDFVDELTDQELVFVLCHEVMHNAMEHHIRRGARCPDRWNRAADYVINLDLSKFNMTMPKGGLLDPQYDGMSTEQVYNLLEDEGKGGGGGGASDGSGEGNGKGKGCADPGRCGGIIDATGSHDKGEIERLSQEQQTRLQQAASVTRAKAGGDIPEHLQMLIDQLVKPKVDWRAVLRPFIDSNVSTDSTWSRPNRRHIHNGIYLPGMENTGLGHIVAVFDTSGSVCDPKIVAGFVSELQAAFDENVGDLTVIYADTRVRGVEEFSSGDEIVLNPVGGGGTAFSDTFRFIAENILDATCVIYFTDLYVSDFGEASACPCMWAVWGSDAEFERNSPNVPFGIPVHITE